MKRRTRTHLFLFAMVALLVAAVSAELRRERALEVDPLTTIDTAAVKSVIVNCNACKQRRFEKRDDGHWRMLEPFAQAARDEALTKLVAIAHAPVRFRHPAGELDGRKLGLDPPQATLQLDGTLLKFGTTDAIHGDRYVEVARAVALVPDRFSMLLFAAPENELAEPPPAIGQ